MKKAGTGAAWFERAMTEIMGKDFEFYVAIGASFLVAAMALVAWGWLHRPWEMVAPVCAATVGVIWALALRARRAGS
jgi:predicted RND superfamily exporter protein